MQEEWRTAPGWPAYEVSSLGRMRRGTPSLANNAQVGKILKQRRRPDGHMTIGVSCGTYSKPVLVHRLVALAFVGQQPTPDHQVAHWDGDPANNVPSNLRWATAKENAQDNARLGVVVRGERHGMARLTNHQVSEIKKLKGSRVTHQQIAAWYGVSRTVIGDIFSGKKWAWL